MSEVYKKSETQCERCAMSDTPCEQWTKSDMRRYEEIYNKNDTKSDVYNKRDTACERCTISVKQCVRGV